MVRAELLKFRSLSGNLVALVGSALVVTVMAYVMADSGDGLDASMIVAEPVSLPMEYYAYVVMILGVLIVTADLDTGTARVTAGLVPWRGRVMGGKFLLAGALGLACAVPVLVLVVLAAALGGDVAVSAMIDADAVGPLVSDIAAVVLAGLLGVAVGLLVRSTALAVSLLLLWSFALETLLVFVVPDRVGALLPFKTIGGSRVLMDELSALQGLAVFALYVGVATLLATLVRLHSRDSPA
ncbi:hypothetical protein [Nocardioides lijunqiniae]|uniref:hypothetical protein n=1 Tax=Nocardioides lijunqiniae TaxID=2760832 RepID=UPI001878A809|nr:hypothetical protein [Nocardioides lijunqiniae]